jgi:hypothetical protein
MATPTAAIWLRWHAHSPLLLLLLLLFNESCCQEPFNCCGYTHSCNMVEVACALAAAAAAAAGAAA